MGPPSSGAHTVAQTLRLIEPFDLGTGPRAALNARSMHLIAEAEKLAYADRNRYLADPDFVRVPSGLLDDGYLARRRALIAPLSAAERVQAGVPDEKGAALPGDDATVEVSGTSHVSIIDGDGNAVSMTTTIEAGFGSRLWAAGFLLNNELTDFSFRPTDAQGRPIANRIEGGKRPRSSMAPTIVFDADGQVKAVLGSPGGSRIILYVVKSIVALVDWNMDAQAAAALANFGSRGQGLRTRGDRYGTRIDMASLDVGHHDMAGAAAEAIRPPHRFRRDDVRHADHRAPRAGSTRRWRRSAPRRHSAWRLSPVRSSSSGRASRAARPRTG